jgi:hypothetical protein
MKYPFFLTMIACLTLLIAGQTPSGSASGQSPCSLTPEQSPEIRGVRLGMSTEQLHKLFPEVNNRQRIDGGITASKQPDAFGAASFGLHPDGQAPNPQFEGVNYISIRLLDERVVSFQIAYAPTEWNSVDEFVARLAEGLRLPRVSWETGNESSILKCNGFRIDAYASKNSRQSTVRVWDTSVDKIVEDRKEAAREKVRQAFKP